MSSYVIRLIVIYTMMFEVGFAQTASPRTINELLDRAEEVSPEIQAAKARLEITKQSLVKAGEIPNPEVTIGNWKGRANSQTWKQTDVTITQPIELGGKRGSRIDVAESQIKEANFQLAALSAELRLKILFSVYRHRQLLEELDLLTEAKETFKRLVSNFKNRPQLSPEQSTTLFNFKLAERDYDLKLEETKSEMNNLSSEIKLLTGYESNQIEKALPVRAKKWPSFNTFHEINSPTLKVLSAQAEMSEKELQLAKADVWPTVNIGPSYTTQSQFGDQANILGVVVTFPIPVLNQNDGARAIAAKNISTSKKLIELEKSVQEVRRGNLLKTYVSSSRTLEEQADANELYSKHHEIEANFLKGLLTSPLVLESHRQMFENQRLYHDRELKTLDVYYQLVLLEGRKVEGF